MFDADDASKLKPYLPRLLLEWLVDAPDERMRTLEGTLAFVDISGFTKMSERLGRHGKVGAEEVTSVINAGFAKLLTSAYNYGGGLLKFGGDALLVFFNGEQHEQRACAAAAAMRQELREFARLKVLGQLVSLRMSVGLHSGTFQFFLAGESHAEFIITGPEASTTVLMESTAEAGEILCSSELARRLDPKCVGRAKGEGMLLKRSPDHDPQAPVEAPDAARDLAPYVPVAVRRHISQHGAEAEHRLATVAFIHFSGTDAMLADGKAADAAGVLHGLVSIAQRRAEEFGVSFLGTDIDRDGGKIILTSGVPSSRGNDEEAMLRTLRAIFDDKPPLSIRAGVHRGHVFAADVGPAFRRTYTVMGDTVNLAARLMARAKPGEIIATPAVLDRSRTTFETAPLEPFLVKGKKAPIHAVFVGALGAPRVAESAERLPLTGRESEVAALRAALDAAVAGRGSLIEIIGDAGIGKSRLIDEILEGAGAVERYRAASEQYSASTPYFSFRRLLRDITGIGEHEPPDSALRRLRARINELAPGLSPWLPLIAIPYDLPSETTPEVEQIAPSFRKQRLQLVIRMFIAKLLDRPAILHFEDAHWLDDESRDLLRALAEDIPQRPWLVCVTRRNSGAALDLGLSRAVTQMHLPPLSPEATAMLAAAASGGTLLGHETTSVAERAGGNPLFVQEMVAAMRGGGSALPDSIESVITARIDSLEARDRALLRQAAVIGLSFEASEFDAIAEASASDDTDPLERLAEFIETDRAGVYRFRQSLFRDVAYEAMPYRRRRDLHQRIGASIEQRGEQHAHEHASVLSLHFHRAERYDKAWQYSRIAGARSHEMYANAAAAEFYQRALESARRLDPPPLGEIADVAEALGDVNELIGAFEPAAAAYAHALRTRSGKEPDAELRLIRKQGVVRERLGKYTQALRWYGRGLRRIDGGGALLRHRTELSLAYAGVRYRQGRYEDCTRWCRRVVADAERTGDRKNLAHAYYLLDAAYTDLGSAESETYRRLALPIFEELGDLVGQANVLNNLGVDAYFEGRWAESLDYYQRSRSSRERAGDVVGVATAANNIGEILSDQGRFEEAEGYFREAYNIWRSARYHMGVAVVTSNLGRLAARAGRLDEARDALSVALDDLRAIKAENFAIETAARLAECHLYAGDAVQAMALLDEALVGLTGLGGSVYLRAMLLRLKACALLQSADATAAGSTAEESLQLARTLRAEYDIALALHVLSEVREGGASDAVAEGAAILESLGVVRMPPSPAHPLSF